MVRLWQHYYVGITSKSIKVTLQNVNFETLVGLSLAAIEPQPREMWNSSVRSEEGQRSAFCQSTLPFPNTSQFLMTIVQMPWLWQRALRATIFIEQADLKWHCNIQDKHTNKTRASF